MTVLFPYSFQIGRDESTGASRGFGFVSFDSFEASDAAIEALSNQHLLNRPITVSYAMKKDGKGGERHGTPAERLLAAQARKNNALPEYRPFNFNAPYTNQPPGAMNGAPLPPPGMPAIMGPPGVGMQAPPPPPPPGFNAYLGGSQPGLPPPPPPALHYTGPPPSTMYDGPPPQFMTGSNGAPLGARR